MMRMETTFRYSKNHSHTFLFRIYASILALLISTVIYGQNFSDGFNFYMPLFDSAKAEFLPSVEITPIDGQNFIMTNSTGEFTYNGEAVKFLGVNFTTTGAFPPKDKAAAIAARLQKMGFNLVRFHHIDNGWSNASLFSATPNTREFNETNLDRMFYLIAKLKEKGIFINMNLNVSRRFTEEDGVVGADSLDSYGKGVTQYDPHLIFLQKEYAYNLLTRNNPYTGLPLANDPVMAMVEIINENSLFRMWRQGALKPYSQGGKLISRHSVLLDDLWNDYLATKYITTDNLAEAWNENTKPPGPELLINGNFEDSNIEENWEIELHETAQASFSHTNQSYNGNGAVRVDVTAVSGTSWHIQFKQHDFSLLKDSVYIVEFYARSSNADKIKAGVSKDVDPWTYYDGESFDIDSEWKKCSFTFVCPENNNNHGRIAFTFDNQIGAFYIDDVSVKRTGIAGLENGESLESRNVSRIHYIDGGKYSDNRKIDNTDFLYHVQSDFLSEMYQYLKEQIGVRVPITGTNWFIGPEDLYVQSKLDYVDNHAYWDHPQFPNVSWSPTDWKINNTPMVQSQEGGTISRLFSAYQIKDKPYTISEYNHGYPNQYQSELLPIVMSYAAFTGTDAIMLFDYNGTNEEDFISGYFNIQPNPVIMANVPIFAYVYRNNLISEASTTHVIQYNRNDLLLLPFQASSSWSTSYPFNPMMALSHKLVTADFEADSTTSVAELPNAGNSPYTSSTSELRWDDSGLFTVETPQFTVICGQLDEFKNTSVGQISSIDIDKFATLTILSQDSNNIRQSRKGIITLTSRVQNTGMIWDGNNTVHNNWGSAPTLIDPVRAIFKLNLEADTLFIYPLSPTGQPIGIRRMIQPFELQTFTVHLNQTNDKTLWYGYEAVGNGTHIATGFQDTDFDKHNFTIYPNPSKDYINIEFKEVQSSDIEVNLLDLSGRLILNRRFIQKGISLKIPCSRFNKGVYVLQISSNDFSESRLIMLED